MRYFSFFALVLLFAACSPTQKSEAVLSLTFPEQQIRLGDGVPLGISLQVNGVIEDPAAFYSRFDSMERFVNMIAKPKTTEALNALAHGYPSVDSIFGHQRAAFLAQIRRAVQAAIQNEGIRITEVVVPDVRFPDSYVSAMERAGLQRQELENIRQQTIVEIAQTEKERKMTEARARVQIAQEEANAKVQGIQAQIEERRRAAELARAETQSQLDYKRAMTEAERQRALNGAELEKLTGLKDIEIQKLQQINDADYKKQVDLAKMYGDNPHYATFVVDKELASKVSIAVLPSGNMPNVLEDFWKNRK